MTADPGDLPEVLQFMRLVWALHHALQSASKRMNRDLGITGPQRLVLRVIGRFPGISAGDLAGMLHVHPSTLTGVLARLSSRRLIARTVDPGDRRRTILRLTEAGQRLDRLQAGTVESAVRSALKNTSAADHAAARRLLTRMTEALEG